MKNNRLRELLNEGKPTVGTHVIIPWPRIVEVIGLSSAFDYIEYVGEYSTFTMEQLENFGRAIELFPNMSSMIKVEEQGRGLIATRAIDAGIQNVLFTDCRSAEDVRECIRFVRSETPEAGGIHGTGMRRGALGSSPVEWVKAMNDVVIAIMIAGSPGIARLVRSLALDIRTRDYIAAAQTRGEPGLRMMFVEILPNARGPIIIDAMLRVGYAIFSVGTLGFLGLGLPPPNPDWGSMVQVGHNYIFVNPWSVIWPTVAISSLVVGLNLLADGLREESLRYQ